MSKQETNIQIIINQNNELREKLTEGNKAFYEDLLVYTRTAGLLYNDQEIESNLMQILQDILLAQNDGESAESYFGKNPQEVADELIQNMGKVSKKEFLKLVGLLFGISSFFSLFSQLTSIGNQLNLLVLVLNGLISLLGVSAATYAVHKSVYLKIARKKYLSFLLIWLASCLIIGAFVLVEIFTPSVFILTIPNLGVMIIIVVLVLAVTINAITSAKEKQILRWALIPFVWSMGGVGLAMRFEATQAFMLSTNGKIMTAVLAVVGLIIYVGLSYLATKEPTKKIA